MAVRWQYDKPLWGQRVDWDAWGMPAPELEMWFNDNAGTLLSNASGNGNNGTLTNGPVWTPTERGTGIYFDGSDDFVATSRVLDVTALPVSIHVSLSVASLAAYRGVFESHSNFAHAGFWLGLQTTGVPELAFGDNSGAGSTDRRSGAPSLSVVAGQTAALTGVIRGATDMSFYKDGLAATMTYSGTGSDMVVTTDTCRIGRVQTNAATNDYVGTIDRVMVWPDALTALQAQALQGPIPIWTPQYYSLPAGGSSIAAIMRYYRNRRVA